MAVTINGQHGTYSNVKDTFPVSTTLTGTVSSVNDKTRIVGSGTAFLTEISRGEWLYVAAETEVRQVREVLSNTELILEEKFTNTLTGATAKRVPRQTYRSISWLIDDDGTAKIDGQTFPAGKSGTLGLTRVNETGKRPAPIIIDSTTNANEVFIEIQF